MAGFVCGLVVSDGSDGAAFIPCGEEASPGVVVLGCEAFGDVLSDGVGGEWFAGCCEVFDGFVGVVCPVPSYVVFFHVGGLD